MSDKIVQKVISLDLLCAWITFIDELATFGEKIVSMIISSAQDNMAPQKYKIIRGPAGGPPYAISIAEKYQLSYDSLKRRIQS